MIDMLSDDDIRARVDAIRAEVVEAIPRERARRRRRFGVIAGAAAAAVAITGGALIVRASNDAITYEVVCYDGPSLSANSVQVESALGVDQSGGADRTATDPVVTCGDMWRMGLIGQEELPVDPNAANFDVPDLVGCTLPNGIAAGFPRGASTFDNRDFCNELGLAPWE